MPFKKGKSGNPNGRPSGVLNKIGANLRQKIIDFLDSNFDTIQDEFNNLDSPRDRIKLYIELLNFVLPKMRGVEGMDILDLLSEKDLDRLIDKITNEK